MSLTSPAARPPSAPASARLRAAAWILAAVAAYFLFFFDLSGVGMIGPDEPRYAAIGREMARSGDWVTPRLWGDTWFEKPALLYWMTGTAFRLGLGRDLAPRVPVALLGTAFLAFYYFILRREFNARAALFSTAILATSAAWLAFSEVAVTDLPMAAAFSAAMLLSLGWVERGERRFVAAAAALFGIAVLAKGLVPLVLALPLAWFGRKRLLDWLRPAPVASFLAAAAPWYVLCLNRNGWAFFNDFFVKHHLSRFATDALQHRQPLWFYVPILLAGLFPWTPLAALGASGAASPVRGVKRRFLAAWVLFGIVFFSVSTNKLPGYLLPLVPAAGALLGVALDSVRSARAALAACAVLTAAIPAIGRILPDAIARGITHTPPLAGSWWLLAAAVLFAIAVWRLDGSGQRTAAFGLVCALMVFGVVWLKAAVYPTLDRAVSTRAFWHTISGRRAEVCVEKMNRSWRYNLNYYSETPLPDCADEPRRFHVVQEASRPPALAEASLPATSSSVFPSRSSR